MSGTRCRGFLRAKLSGLLALLSVATPTGVTAADAEATSRAGARRLVSTTIVEELASPFGALFVVDEEGLRYLRWGAPDGPDQSVIDLQEPWRLSMPYLRPVALVVASAPSQDRVLMIGLGGGGFVHYLRRHFPRTHVDAVEIDPAVVRLAQEHFGIAQGDQLTLHVADGSEFIRGVTIAERYDIIFLDAYSGDEIPAALATPSFLQQVRGALRAEGRVVANVGNVRRAAFSRAFEATFSGRCMEMRAWQDDNVILLGSRGPLPDTSSLKTTAKKLDASRHHAFRMETIARSARPCHTF